MGTNDLEMLVPSISVRMRAILLLRIYNDVCSRITISFCRIFGTFSIEIDYITKKNTLNIDIWRKYGNGAYKQTHIAYAQRIILNSSRRKFCNTTVEIDERYSYNKYIQNERHISKSTIVSILGFFLFRLFLKLRFIEKRQ